jgi:hypothetical protein
VATTRFDLVTSGTSSGALVLTNATWSGNVFSFDVTSAAGQTLSVEYSTNLIAGQWQTLLTTNSATGRVQIVDPNSTASRHRSYRARNAP